MQGKKVMVVFPPVFTLLTQHKREREGELERRRELNQSLIKMANYVQEAKDKFSYIYSCEVDIPFRIKM